MMQRSAPWFRAKAWTFSGLPVPTKSLGTYCPVQIIVYPEGSNPAISDAYKDYLRYPVPQSIWESWECGSKTHLITEDIIFREDGTYLEHHGKCAHSYTQWLNYFEDEGKYSGGYAYFYKPQVPAEDLKENGG